MAAEYSEFVQHIFEQDVHSARRRTVGSCGDIARKHFTGYVCVMPPLYLRIFRKIRHKIGTLLPKKTKDAIKKLYVKD